MNPPPGSPRHQPGPPNATPPPPFGFEPSRWVGEIERCFGKKPLWLHSGECGQLLADAGAELADFANAPAGGRFELATWFAGKGDETGPDGLLEDLAGRLIPGGIVIVRTIDPLFERDAGSGARPPSFWAKALRGLNLHIRAVFGNHPGAVFFLASGDPSRLKTIADAWNALRGGPSPPQTDGAPVLAAWRTAARAVSAEAGEPLLYLLNEGPGPLRISIEADTDGPGEPMLFLEHLKLRREGAAGGRFRWSPVPVPPGGHTLRFVGGDAGCGIGAVRIHAEPVGRETFLERLPFDHYQRYRFAAGLLDKLDPSWTRVLDVGGARGYASLFFPGREIVQMDLEWEDVPEARLYDGLTLPRGEGPFDVVLCTDTLEHVPGNLRGQVIGELCRAAGKALILCGPFSDPMVEQAEETIREYADAHLGFRHRFLDEHAQYGLPDRQWCRDRIEAHSLRTFEFPNGYLPRWLTMQLAAFALSSAPELAEASAHINTAYNRRFYEADNREPAYRYAIVGLRRPADEASAKRLGETPRPAMEPAGADGLGLAPMTLAVSALRLLRGKDAAIAAEAGRIDRLLEHAGNLERQARERDAHLENLTRHADNLEQRIAELGGHANSLAGHGENLAALLAEKDRQIKALQDALAARDGEIANLTRHAENLQASIRQMEEDRQGLMAHAENLAAMERHAGERNQNLLKHSENLAAALEEKDRIAGNLSNQLAEREGVRNELECRLREKTEALGRLEERCRAAGKALAQFLEQLARPGESPPDPAALSAEMAGTAEGLDSARILEAVERFRQTVEEHEQIRNQLQAIRSSLGYKLVRPLGLIPAVRIAPDS